MNDKTICDGSLCVVLLLNGVQHVVVQRCVFIEVLLQLLDAMTTILGLLVGTDSVAVWCAHFVGHEQ